MSTLQTGATKVTDCMPMTIGGTEKVHIYIIPLLRSIYK